jgi:hypothetical protein
VKTALFTLLFSELQIQQKLMFYSEKLERHFSASFSPTSLHRFFVPKKRCVSLKYLDTWKKYFENTICNISGHDY